MDILLYICTHAHDLGHSKIHMCIHIHDSIHVVIAKLHAIGIIHILCVVCINI